MLLDFADHTYNAIPTNNLAFITNWLNTCSYFHTVLRIPKNVYFDRYMIRPRVKSYGEISKRTLSPGKIRIKCIRIFPLMCARTVCPFSSSTLNIALGNGSKTTPSTSMTSSLAIIRQSTGFLLYRTALKCCNNNNLQETTPFRAIRANLDSKIFQKTPALTSKITLISTFHDVVAQLLIHRFRRSRAINFLIKSLFLIKL